MTRGTLSMDSGARGLPADILSWQGGLTSQQKFILEGYSKGGALGGLMFGGTGLGVDGLAYQHEYGHGAEGCDP
ncbi:hypothetical protein ACGIF2_02045 [Cellulomonas sp. P22]|uniref:hypothetical protein n=1 Tax=Cellulomonas sp. P22 TaxID=3373189 RepID=UPI00379AE9C1